MGANIFKHATNLAISGSHVEAICNNMFRPGAFLFAAYFS